jgi:Na+/H+ antiporter NhaD/arsenite permease-like protein
LAGNLFIVGSIANIIVIDQAERLGIRITWREHARVGYVRLPRWPRRAWLYFRAGAQC